MDGHVNAVLVVLVERAGQMVDRDDLVAQVWPTTIVEDTNLRVHIAALRKVLRDAGLQPSDVQYINAHGTSTPLGDIAECIAVKRAFGEHAKKLAVSSTKSMTGHLLGAAGGIEAVFTVLAIRDQIAPPTINLVDVDPQCDLDFVPLVARRMKIGGALSNSFGFGGQNTALIFTRWDA